MSKLPYTPNWNKISKSGGYPAIHCPDHPKAWSTGYIHVHRIVMEQSLGRILSTDEVVHHIDQDRSNYHISNLELTTSSLHMKGHSLPPTILDMVCAQCGLEFKRRKGQDPKAKNYTRNFCSRSCNGKFYHSNGFNK
jgi:predicted Zn-ribbon and HTH transcriptional regulator